MKLKTIPEYAKDNGVTVQTIYNKIKNGSLKTKTILGKKLIIISK